MFEIGELATWSRRAAHAEVRVASDDELCAAAIALEQARAALDAAEAHVLAELERRGVCDREFGLGTASWLADRAHASRPHVMARLRVGTKLRSLSALDAALSAGHLTFEHARVLVDAANPRIADDLAAGLDELIELALHTPFAIWRRDVRRPGRPARPGRRLRPRPRPGPQPPARQPGLGRSGHPVR